MMLTGSIRQFSTKRIIDKLFHVVHSSKYQRSTKLTHLIDTYILEEKKITSNFLNDVIQQWAIEQPSKDALWTCKNNIDNDYHKLTFHDIHKQSSRFANVLTGKEFGLTAGNTVLVILPDLNEQRILLQLACLQNGLVFSPCDPKDLSSAGVPERIQKLAVDCIITDEDHLERVREYTHNPLRPLKKGLITNDSASKPLPIGWSHFIRSAMEGDSTYTKSIHIHPNVPVIRLLSSTNDIVQYSQETFNRGLISTAFWLNTDSTSRLIWMKNQNNINSIAPWLFGSSLFQQETQDLQTMFNTFQNNPIDTFCGTVANYQMLDNQQRENHTQLQRLFSTESIDPMIKARWHSLTNLHIRDDYAHCNEKSMLKSFSHDLHDETHKSNVQFYLGPIIPAKLIPLKKFIYQYSVNQDEIPRKNFPS